MKHRLFNVNGISTILRCLTIKAPTCSDHIVEDSIFAEEVARCVLFRFLEYMQTDQDENLVDSTYFKMTAIMAHISVLQVHLALKKLSCKKLFSRHCCTGGILTTGMSGTQDTSLVR